MKNLDPKIIRRKCKELAQAERKNLVILLRYLHENQRRRLFSEFGFESLHDYMVRELKYSDDEAQRRVSAMWAMRDVPEVAQAIEDGSVSLTHLVMAQVLFRKEKKAGRPCAAEQKREIIARVRGKSTREAAKVMAEINPEMKKTREFKIEMIENEELRAKLIEVRGLYGHLDLTLEELLLRLCNNELGITERRRDAQPSPAAPRKKSVAEERRKAWCRDQGKCRNCGSTHKAQIDHIIPPAAGGLDVAENMRVLCANCNIRAAMNFYGERKMGDYVRDVHQPYGHFNNPRSRNGLIANPKLAEMIEWVNSPSAQRRYAS